MSITKYVFNVVQTNSWEVEIEAETENDAINQFNDYLVEDFGEPHNSVLDWEVFNA